MKIWDIIWDTYPKKWDLWDEYKGCKTHVHQDMYTSFSLIIQFHCGTVYCMRFSWRQVASTDIIVDVDYIRKYWGSIQLNERLDAGVLGRGHCVHCLGYVRTCLASFLTIYIIGSITSVINQEVQQGELMRLQLDPAVQPIEQRQFYIGVVVYQKLSKLKTQFR